MNKIKLNLDRLSVETFETGRDECAGRGTVEGHWSQVGTCDGRVATCQAGGTCALTCGRRCTGIYCL